MNFIGLLIGYVSSILGLGAYHSLDDKRYDEFGGNGVDREYMEYLHKMVDTKQMTEEEVLKKLQDKMDKGDGKTDLIAYYNSFKRNSSGGYKLDSALGNSFSMPDVGNLIKSLTAYFTRNELTGAENEQNAFNAEQAQMSRDFTEYMARNKYTMETQSMQDAGVNPAVVYGGGNLVPTASNGAHAQGSPLAGGNIVDLLSTLVRMPLEMKQMEAEIARSKADAQKAADEGWAARYNAETNRINAGTGQEELEVHKRQASVAEAQVEIQRMLADSNVHINDETAKKIAEETLYVRDQRVQLPKLLEISEKNANTAQKQAIAAMRQADAAVQNAATNDYLSNYQTDYLYSQRLGQDIMNGQNSELLKVLPEKLQAEIKEFKARGFFFDEQGKLANKNQALVTAETVRTYVGAATDVARAACQVAGTVMTGGLGGTTVSMTNAMGGTTTSTASSSGFNPFITTGLYQ